MPGPTYAWTSIPSTDLDQDSPLTTTVLESYRKNQIHLKEVLLGTGSYRGEVPHAHAGVEDGALGSAWSENILADSAPGTGSGDDAWTKSGWSVDATNGFDTTTSNADYAHQILYRTASRSKAAFGSAGANIVLSLYVKAQGTLPASGELWFGLADGSASAFIANCKAVIAFGSITANWKRFYMVLAAKGGGATTDVRFLIRNGTMAPNQKLWVSGCAANLGSTLTYWSPGMNESTSSHDDFKKFSIGPPVWETAISLTGATAIVGA